MADAAGAGGGDRRRDGAGLEQILLLMLKPVLPVALPPASGWPWLWAIGAMVVISLLVGYDLIACCWQRCRAGTASGCRCQRLAAEIVYSAGVCGGGDSAGG